MGHALIGLIAPSIGRGADFVERSSRRDTQHARLEWLRAKAFAATTGGVTERRNVVELSEELARKGQDLRERTRDVDLAKADVDLISMIVRLRGAAAEEGPARGLKGSRPRDDGGRRLSGIEGKSLPDPGAPEIGPGIRDQASCHCNAARFGSGAADAAWIS